MGGAEADPRQGRQNRFCMAARRRAAKQVPGSRYPQSKRLRRRMTGACENRRGIATARQLEKRLSSIALGRIKKPDEAKITEQLKAIELLVKIRGMAEEEKAEPMEVKIRVLDASGKEIECHGD